MSASPAAPSRASVRACAITSPSEWPTRPRGWSIVTPPRTRGTPSPNACASTPRPIRSPAPVTRRTLTRPGAPRATRSRSPPRGVGWSLPHGPRRRWTETSPAASAGPCIVVGPVADVCDLGCGCAGDVDEPLEERRVGLSNAEARRARHDVDRKLRGARPLFERGGLVPGDADEQRRPRAGARGIRARPGRGRRSSRRPIPRRRQGRSRSRCRQSSQCSSFRAMVTPSAAHTTCGPSPAASATDAPVALLVDQGLPHVEEDRAHGHGPSSSTSLATSSRSLAVVTFTSRGSPATTATRPPARSTSEAQSVAPASFTRVACAQAFGDEHLGGLDRHERFAIDRLGDDATLDALHRVADGDAWNDAVDTLCEPREQTLDHCIVDERSSRVVDEDDERILRHLCERDPDRLRPGRSPRDHGGHLRRDELLGEKDRRLLPAGRGGDHDRVDPLGGVEPLEALGEERPSSETGERLRSVASQPRAGAGRDEDRPGASGFAGGTRGSAHGPGGGCF